MTRYIVRNGEKVFLTWEDEKLLHRQDCIERANNTIETLAPWIDNLCEESLVELGEKLIDADSNRSGDRDWACLKDFIPDTDGSVLWNT